MIIQGDALVELKGLRSKSVNCCVTSPPYWGLRDYGTASWTGGDSDCDHIKNTASSNSSTLKNDGRENFGSGDYEKSTVVPFRDICGKCGAVRKDKQLGLEQTPDEYVEKMVEIFGEVRRVLRDDGTLWLNLGDSYASNIKGSGGPSEKQLSNSGSRYIEQKFNHGLKEKNLVGIPWRVAFALQADGWYLRQDIIWAKPNPMPESVQDRCTKAHEYIFLMSKSPRYYFNNEAIKEPAIGGANGSLYDHGKTGSNKNKDWSQKVPSGWDTGPGAHDNKIGRYKKRDLMGKENRADASGRLGREPGWRQNTPDRPFRNKRSVWTVATQPYKEAHFATFPPELITPCILAGCPENGIVLDPFFGSGTVGEVCRNSNRDFIGIELNPDYVELAEKRCNVEQFRF